MEELYGLEETLLHDLEPIYGLIFLFKWDAKVETKRPRSSPNLVEEDHGGGGEGRRIFFAQQTVQNACATQAILSILMNLPRDAPVDLGPEVTSFKEFSLELPPDMRGEAIGSCELIRRVHNSFAPFDMLTDVDPSAKDDDKEDPFHFVSFVHINGRVYEFDGMKPGPLCHGKPEQGSKWTGIALEAIREKIESIQASSATGEIRFNLMALIKDRITVYQELIEQNGHHLAELESSSQQVDPAEIQMLKMRNHELTARLLDEESKRTEWKMENAIKRHNFFPFILELLKQMAKCGALNEYHRSLPPPIDKKQFK